MSNSAPEFECALGLAALLAKYREVTGRIVERHDRSRYVLAADRARLARLNTAVDTIARTLQERMPENDHA